MIMIVSLFSVFDPYSNIFFNWIIIPILLLLLPIKKWLIISKQSTLYIFISKKILIEFKILTTSFIPGILLLFLSLLFFIILNNLIGLLPYIFTSTSHIRVTLSLSLILWISFNLFGWLNNTYHIIAHLVPTGTPFLLINFIVLIESIRSIIRPITLSIRLSANIIAGHLLLSLLGNIGPKSNFITSFGLIIIQIILLILELAVAFIQSYVFSILSMLYISEVN